MNIIMSSIVDMRKSLHNRPHQFLKYLCKRNDVTVVSVNDWWKEPQQCANSCGAELRAVLDRVDYRYLTNSRISPVLQEALLSRRASKIAGEKDYDVHLNYNSLIASRAFPEDVPTVFDLADDLVSMIDNSPQIPRLLRPLGHIIGGRRLSRNIESAAAVTSTSEALLRRYDVPSSKAKLIPNGVDTSLFRHVDGAKESIGVNGFVVGYVGALREWVDMLPIFQALKSLDEEVSMLIVGSEGYFQKNLELARSCGVSGRVKFVGAVSYTEVPKYISAMDVGLIPFAKNEVTDGALPLKLFEYMSCERPVISTDIATVRRSVGGRVLYARGANDFESHIRSLRRDEDMRTRLGREGRDLVESSCDWSGIVAQLECTLNEVLEG